MPIYSIKDVPEGTFLVKTKDDFRGPGTVTLYPDGSKLVHLHGIDTYEDKWFEPGDTFEPCFIPSNVPVPGTYTLCKSDGEQRIPCTITVTNDLELYYPGEPNIVTLIFSNCVMLTPLSNVAGIFLPLENIETAPKPYLNRHTGQVNWPKGSHASPQP